MSSLFLSSSYSFDENKFSFRPKYSNTPIENRFWLLKKKKISNLNNNKKNITQKY